MATVTKLKLGPLDHGRPISYEDFLASATIEGYHYELIEGRVYVSPFPDPPHARLDSWIYRKLDRYSTEHPDTINFVYNKVRVFVPGRKRVTCPEPDIAAYHDFPLSANFDELQWEDLHPLLAVEVLSPGNIDKDLVRNVDLYWKVRSIREYWVVNGLPFAEQPSLRVHRRRGTRWHIFDLAYGETYTTKLLPDFELLIDPRKITTGRMLTVATVSRLKLGPADQGRSLTYHEYQDADYASGFQYELIDGKLQVAALPRWKHGKLDKWLYGLLDGYALTRPDIINMVYNRAVVFVPGRPATTCPEPDITAYHDFPLDLDPEEVDWDNVSPVLVAEILSAGNAEKDLIRNVELYLQVPSIREYWIVDGLQDANTPSLRVHRRRGKRWHVIDVAYGGTYTTKLLPGFELIVDPRR